MWLSSKHLVKLNVVVAFQWLIAAMRIWVATLLAGSSAVHDRSPEKVRGNLRTGAQIIYFRLKQANIICAMTLRNLKNEKRSRRRNMKILISTRLANPTRNWSSTKTTSRVGCSAFFNYYSTIYYLSLYLSHTLYNWLTNYKFVLKQGTACARWGWRDVTSSRCAKNRSSLIASPSVKQGRIIHWISKN